MLKIGRMAGLFLGVALLAGCVVSEPSDVALAEVTDDACPTDCVPQAALDAYIQLRWDRRVDQWNVVEAPKGAVVFLGSSIIEEGEWPGLFPNTSVVNRGIGADTTQGVLNRLDQIETLKPSAVFLYIGGNDFSRLGDTPESSFLRLERVVDALRGLEPQPHVYVHTLFPREAEFGEKIIAYNELIRENTAREGVTVIDVHDWFLGENGAIDPAYSNDRIHLSGEAYGIWANEIRAYVESEGSVE